jgi:hypothetical protein
MHFDKILSFREEQVHEAAVFGLESLLKAQFPNGAFPQVWTQAVAKQPSLPAQYPSSDWKTSVRVKNYWDYYTLNDDLAGSVCDTLILAHRVYGGNDTMPPSKSWAIFCLMRRCLGLSLLGASNTATTCARFGRANSSPPPLPAVNRKMSCER